jgi:dolichyl-phosphate-mannose-protein mannosyltransferase
MVITVPSGEGHVSRPRRHVALRFVVTFLAALSLIDLLSMIVIVGLHAYSPTVVAPTVLAPMTFILAGASSAAVLLALLYFLLSYPAYRIPILLLAIIVLGVLGAHVYTITLPDVPHCYDPGKNVDGCIMDEVYYVPAAQTLLAGEKCAPYADSCNLEHPFLSKAFIAAGIAIFGNSAFGWRIFEVLLGTFSIPLLFGICWSMTRNARLSLYASFLLAFETLFFVHSSIAVIDVSAVFFALLGFLLYFAKVHWWRFDRITLAGVAFGLSALSKETAIMLLFVLASYHLLFGEGNLVRRFSSTLELTLSVFLVFAVGLQAYDSLFGSGSATTFLGQIDFILRYGASLTMTPSSQVCFFIKQTTTTVTGCGWIDSVLKTPITPLNWVTYYSPIGYLITNITVTSGSTSYTYVAAGYYGITNQFEVWLAYLWGAYVVYVWRKTRRVQFATETEARDFRLARLALMWFLIVFVAYVALFLYGRVTYPYYFIQAVPALAIGAAYFLSRSWFPQGIAYIVLAGVFLWFFIFYPDKSFLPEQFRAWLGH